MCEVDPGSRIHGLSVGFRVLVDPRVISTMNAKPKGKRHSAVFKAKVGLEAVIGIKTVSQIAREYSEGQWCPAMLSNLELDE